MHESTTDEKMMSSTSVFSCSLKLFLDLDEMQNRMDILSIVLRVTEVIYVKIMCKATQHNLL